MSPISELEGDVPLVCHLDIGEADETASAGAPDPATHPPVCHGPPLSPPEALAQRLLDAMAGRSIHWLARTAKVNRDTVRKLLKAERKRMACVYTIEQLAVACGVSRKWLAYGEAA